MLFSLLGRQTTRSLYGISSIARHGTTCPCLPTHSTTIPLKPFMGLMSTPRHAVTATSNDQPPSHAKFFAVERLWVVGMTPFFPAALFFQNAFIDYGLAVTVALHIHWGLEIVLSDYARPLVVGETLPKVSRIALYILSAVMFAGLLHFNYNDVGITRAFKLDLGTPAFIFLGVPIWLVCV